LDSIPPIANRPQRTWRQDFEEQAKLLSMLRCDQIQGYQVNKPLAFDDMTAYLSRTRK
jgi:EAL domain-containing protein (putative c-di-GMP-specific phosphodiesterase class I)